MTLCQRSGRKESVTCSIHLVQNTDPMAFLDFSCYRDHSPAILTIFIFSSKLITKLLTGYSYPLWTLLNANNLQWFLHNQTTIYQWRHNMLEFRAKTFSHLALLPNCTEDYCHRLKNILVCNSFQLCNSFSFFHNVNYVLSYQCQYVSSL